MLPKGYSLFIFLLPDRTTVNFLDPLLPYRVWFLPFCSQTGVFKLRKMLPDRVKITAPQRHTPVYFRTPGFPDAICNTIVYMRDQIVPPKCFHSLKERLSPRILCKHVAILDDVKVKFGQKVIYSKTNCRFAIFPQTERKRDAAACEFL